MNHAGIQVVRPESPVVGDGRPGPLLVWGLDGTVVDSYAAIRASVDRALEEHGLIPAGPQWVTQAILRSLVGLSIDRIFGRLVSHHGPGPDLIASLVAAYREAFRSVAPSRARLLPGIASLLADLHDRGAVSVVASSDGPAADLLLDRFGIAGHFAGVVSDDDVDRRRRKPDSGLVLSACAAHGYDPDQVVVIGDSVFDVEMGQAAGADTVWVTWGNQSRGDLLERTPTHLVEDVGQLATLLGAYVERTRGTMRTDGAAGSHAGATTVTDAADQAPRRVGPGRQFERSAARSRRHRRAARLRCDARDTYPGRPA